MHLICLPCNSGKYCLKLQHTMFHLSHIIVCNHFGRFRISEILVYCIQSSLALQLTFFARMKRFDRKEMFNLSRNLLKQKSLPFYTVKSRVVKHE